MEGVGEDIGSAALVAGFYGLGEVAAGVVLTLGLPFLLILGFEALEFSLEDAGFGIVEALAFPGGVDEVYGKQRFEFGLGIEVGEHGVVEGDKGLGVFAGLDGGGGG